MPTYSEHPDLQEKIRRVIEQGFIDAEDFNGVRGREILEDPTPVVSAAADDAA